MVALALAAGVAEDRAAVVGVAVALRVGLVLLLRRREREQREEERNKEVVDGKRGWGAAMETRHDLLTWTWNNIGACRMLAKSGAGN